MNPTRELKKIAIELEEMKKESQGEEAVFSVNPAGIAVNVPLIESNHMSSVTGLREELKYLASDLKTWKKEFMKDLSKFKGEVGNPVKYVEATGSEWLKIKDNALYFNDNLIVFQSSHDEEDLKVIAEELNLDGYSMSVSGVWTKDNITATA